MRQPRSPRPVQHLDTGHDLQLQQPQKSAAAVWKWQAATDKRKQVNQRLSAAQTLHQLLRVLERPGVVEDFNLINVATAFNKIAKV